MSSMEDVRLNFDTDGEEYLDARIGDPQPAIHAPYGTFGHKRAASVGDSNTSFGSSDGDAERGNLLPSSTPSPSPLAVRRQFITTIGMPQKHFHDC